MNKVRSLFSTKYSFIPSSNSYTLIKKWKNIKIGLKQKKDLWMSKIPISLRIYKLSSYEKSMIMATLMFTASVKYLGKSDCT